MSIIDLEWLKTDLGHKALESVKLNGKLKNFALLEKPTLSPAFQFKDINFKISIIGKNYTGKTSFVNSLCFNNYNTSLFREDNVSDTSVYFETPGISITHVFWPCKLATNNNKFLMINYSLWDVGRLYAAKYDYITPSYEENIDCYMFIFSWTDRQSFIEILDQIKQLSNNNNQIPLIVIGTKFDQIVHSEIDQDMIEELESISKSKIIRFSIKSCSQDQVYYLMNRLSDLLIKKDINF